MMILILFIFAMALGAYIEKHYPFIDKVIPVVKAVIGVVKKVVIYIISKFRKQTPPAPPVPPVTPPTV